MDRRLEASHRNRCRRVRDTEQVIEDPGQTDDVSLRRAAVEALGKPVERRRSR